ncbi:MAG: hypothetical protein AAFP28_01280 [Pseudomonadota bacterium]
MTSEEEGLPSILTDPAHAVLGAAAGGLKKGISTTANDVWSALVGDRVRQWRIRNLVNSAEFTAGFLKRKGIPLDEARVLPDGEVYTLFEGASKAEDQTLQRLWAHLLSERMRPEPEDCDTTLCANLLSSLSPSEADAFLLVANLWNWVRADSEAEKELRKQYPYESDPSASRSNSGEPEAAYAALRKASMAKYEELTEDSSVFGTDREGIARDGLVSKGLIQTVEVKARGGSTSDPFRSGRQEDLGALIGKLDTEQRRRAEIERVKSEISEGPLTKRNEAGPVSILFALTPTGRYLASSLGICDA